GKIDAFLKLSIVAAVLLASSSVAYYYVIYLPDRDARIDAANVAAELHRAEEKTAAEQRRIDEKAAAEDRRSEDQQNAQRRYDRCLRAAENGYNSNWAASCGSKRQEAEQNRAHCVANHPDDKKGCAEGNPIPDAADCTLPRTLANDLE